MAIPSQDIGIQVAVEFESIGFRASVEKDKVIKDWTCYCIKILTPRYSEVIVI
ncbi:MAG: hypothetical protein HRT91_01260 [Piscirickettsiaceae bacterium]|nr:hypothetical protein [Piscirickettsiaceae bacterium]NRB81857.1 hypothetical protein [Saccharospirillaceae bacterium]